MAGSMRKRGKDSWRLEVTIGADFRGKPIRYSKTVHGTKKQAEKELAKFYAACEAGDVSKSCAITITQMCNDVMEQIIEQNMKKNTVRGYKSCLKRIDHSIGDLKASKATPRNIQEWVNKLNKDGLSPKTIKNTYSFLHMCFETMVSWELIGNNPCHHVKLPKNERKNPPYLTKNELFDFLRALDNIPRDKQDYKVAFMLAIFCGLRRGEICGLNEDDVDVDLCELVVRRTRNIEKGRVYEDSPKSRSSIRACAFPNELAEEIRILRTFHKEQQLQLGTKWETSPAMIKNMWGGPMYPATLLDYLKKFCGENGLKETHLHALRHPYVKPTTKKFTTFFEDFRAAA